MSTVQGRCKQRQTHTNVLIGHRPQQLIRNLALLKLLTELRFTHADNSSPSSDPLSFPPLTVLDLEETLAHLGAIERHSDPLFRFWTKIWRCRIAGFICSTLRQPAAKQEVNVVKEPLKPKWVQKEDWAIGVEQGLATEGCRRHSSHTNPHRLPSAPPSKVGHVPLSPTFRVHSKGSHSV